MEKGQVSGGSRARAVGLVSFEIALPSASIRSAVRGITNALNAKSAPGADVRIFREVTCWARGRRFVLPFELAAANVRSAISSTVIAEVLESPQVHSRLS